jgi:hypothetical protein
MVEAVERGGLRLDRALSVLSIAVAALASLAFGWAYGFTYGVNNQTCYMLHGLRLLDPGLFANDWYTSQTLNFHPTFGYLAWLLLAIGGRGGWAVGIADVVAAAGGAFCVYWTARSLLPGPVALAAFLLTITTMVVTGTRELADSYVFDPIFQPSTVASLAFIAAIPPFVRGRWLLSGVMLAISGLFHANYLALGLVAFGIGHLLLGVEDLKSRSLENRALRQLGPSVVALLILSPLFLKAAGGSAADVARAQHILFDIRGPHHYHPRGFVGDFFPMLAWHTLALALGGWLFRREGGSGRRFVAVLLGVLAVVWVGSFFSVVLDVKRVTSLFVWRFAPYADLLAQLVIAATVATLLLAPSASVRASRTSVAIAIASGVGLCIALTNGGQRLIDWLMRMAGIGAVGLALRLALPHVARLASRIPRPLLLRAPWLASVAALWLFWSTVKGPLDAVHAHSNLLTGMAGPETDLYAWIRANTPKESVFLSPPGLERFRLAGERAIDVDWKASTYVASELVEWYRRLEDVSGRRNFRSRDEVVQGYEAMDGARLDMLRNEYHLSYAVVSRGRDTGLGRPVVYSNAHWTVLDLR